MSAYLRLRVTAIVKSVCVGEGLEICVHGLLLVAVAILITFFTWVGIIVLFWENRIIVSRQNSLGSDWRVYCGMQSYGGSVWER